MVLSCVNSEKDVTLKDMVGGRRIRLKAYTVGLVSGVNLLVLRRNGSGPVVVAVRDTGLAVGRGMAEKIIVE
jgi:ferrous iron transport protein A